MDRSSFLPLRALPRVFLLGLEPDQESYRLPRDELDKFVKVLRLKDGDQIGVLPNDGTLIRCELREGSAWPIETVHIHTERSHRVILAQAFPKTDRADTLLRMATELGVAGFLLFPGDRSIVKWEEDKLVEKARRFNAIIRESAEQSFRSTLPTLNFSTSLPAVLASYPNAMVLSESESATGKLAKTENETVLVVGPEGGWSPRETASIGDRGVSLGPLVLRTDTAGPAAIAALLLSP